MDAISDDGMHWMAQMVHKIDSDEPYLLYKKVWYKDPQMPMIFEWTKTLEELAQGLTTETLFGL